MFVDAQIVDLSLGAEAPPRPSRGGTAAGLEVRPLVQHVPLGVFRVTDEDVPAETPLRIVNEKHVLLRITLLIAIDRDY